jgi:hypothetical protein
MSTDPDSTERLGGNRLAHRHRVCDVEQFRDLIAVRHISPECRTVFAGAQLTKNVLYVLLVQFDATDNHSNFE